MIDLLIVALILVSVWEIDTKINKNTFFENHFSKNVCNSLRGIMSICIIFVHLIPISRGVIFNFIRPYGYVFVALFFFISGYGLMFQLINSKQYLNNFLTKRLSAIIIPYLIAHIIFWFKAFIFDNDYINPITMIINTIQGNSIVMYSWYIIVVILFYLEFYIVSKIFKCKAVPVIVSTFIFCLIWCIICSSIFNFAAWWYDTCFVLPVGMIFAKYNKSLCILLKKHYVISLLMVFVGFNMFHYAWNSGLSEGITYHFVPNANTYVVDIIWVVFYELSAIMSSLLIFILCLKIRLDNKILDILGKNSLEIYMYQGIFVSIYSTVFNEQNELLIGILVVVFTVLFAILMNKINRFCISKYKYLLIKHIN